MLNGKVTITRANSFGAPDKIIIMIEDADYTRIATVALSLEDFAKAITGLASVPCKVDKYRSV